MCKLTCRQSSPIERVIKVKIFILTHIVGVHVVLAGSVEMMADVLFNVVVRIRTGVKESKRGTLCVKGEEVGII